MKDDQRMVLYQVNVEDTRTLKRNQWRFSHYGLLVQGALVGTHSLGLRLGDWLVLVLLTAAAGIAIFLILTTQNYIAKLRWQMEKTLSVKGDPTKEISDWRDGLEDGWRALSKCCRWSYRLRRDWWLMLFFVIFQGSVAYLSYLVIGIVKTRPIGAALFLVFQS